MANFKFDGNVEINGNIKSKSTSTISEKKEENHNQWEFFKKIDGLLTDQITKMVNIPSTLFTPAFALPSKAQFVNIMKIIAVIKGVMYKFRRINEILDKNNQKTSERKKLVRLSILNSFEKNKWVVNYNPKK